MQQRIPLIVAGSANPPLAASIAQRLGVAAAAVLIERFPDGEVHVQLREDPRNREVFVIQPTSPPPDEHLFELLALADACRRGGAARVTAVLPYFGYARQDRRANGFEAVSARVVADLLVASGVERIVALDIHTDAIEGFFTIPVERLSAVPVLAAAIREALPQNGVIVSPDLGAAKLADTYARLLDLPVAIVHKTRLDARSVTATRVTGDVQGRTPIIIDDMISTGGTIEAAARAVSAAGAFGESLIVCATHGLFVGGCIDRLRGLGISRLLVTNSILPGRASELPIEIVDVAGLIADCLNGHQEGATDEA